MFMTHICIPLAGSHLIYSSNASLIHGGKETMAVLLIHILSHNLHDKLLEMTKLVVSLPYPGSLIFRNIRKTLSNVSYTTELNTHIA